MKAQEATSCEQQNASCLPRKAKEVAGKLGIHWEEIDIKAISSGMNAELEDGDTTQ